MKVADKMAAHNTGLMSSSSGYPSSPPHPGPNLETGVPGAPNDANMSSGLGPIDVPGQGL